MGSAQADVANDPARQAALAQFGQRSASGSPLDTIFQQFGQIEAQQILQIMLDDISAGINPRQLASDMRGVLDDASYGRAALIARTETLTSWNDAALSNYQANSDIIGSWMWVCMPGAGTCVSCLEEDGTIYNLDEELDDHPNGRCVKGPVTADYGSILSNYGIDAGGEDFGPGPWDDRQTGEEWLLAQDAETQRAAFGSNAAYNAWKVGDAKLADFVKIRHDPVWGDSIQQQSLKGMGLKASDYGAGTAKAAEAAQELSPGMQEMLKVNAADHAVYEANAANITIDRAKLNAAQTVDELRQWLHESVPHLDLALGESPDFKRTKALLDEAATLSEKYPDIMGSLRFIGLSDDPRMADYMALYQAKIDFGGKVFQLRWLGEDAPPGAGIIFRRSSWDSAPLAFTGGSDQYVGGQSLGALLTHEFGHVTESFLTSSPDREVLHDVFSIEREMQQAIYDGTARAVSRYADTNISEMFAESFTAIQYGTDEQRALSYVRELDDLLTQQAVVAEAAKIPEVPRVGEGVSPLELRSPAVLEAERRRLADVLAPSGTPQAVMEHTKQKAAADIAARLAGNPDWPALREQLLQKTLDRLTEYEAPAYVLAETRATYTDTEAVRFLLADWAKNEPDLSVAMQLAAQAELGLGDARIVSGADVLAQTRVEWGDVQGGMRAFLRAQYENTQDFFREAGITEMPIYRGFNWEAKPELSGASFDELTKGFAPMPIGMQPMSSFSTSDAMASQFAMFGPNPQNSGGYHLIVGGMVPVGDVLSTAQTGYGALGELEVVVLGGDRTVWAYAEVAPELGTGIGNEMKDYMMLHSTTETTQDERWRLGMEYLSSHQANVYDAAQGLLAKDWKGYDRILPDGTIEKPPLGEIVREPLPKPKVPEDWLETHATVPKALPTPVGTRKELIKQYGDLSAQSEAARQHLGYATERYGANSPEANVFFHQYTDLHNRAGAVFDALQEQTPQNKLTALFKQLDAARAKAAVEVEARNAVESAARTAAAAARATERVTAEESAALQQMRADRSALQAQRDTVQAKQDVLSARWAKIVRETDFTEPDEAALAEQRLAAIEKQQGNNITKMDKFDTRMRALDEQITASLQQVPPEELHAIAHIPRLEITVEGPDAYALYAIFGEKQLPAVLQERSVRDLQRLARDIGAPTARTKDVLIQNIRAEVTKTPYEDVLAHYLAHPNEPFVAGVEKTVAEAATTAAGDMGLPALPSYTLPEIDHAAERAIIQQAQDALSGDGVGSHTDALALGQPIQQYIDQRIGPLADWQQEATFLRDPANVSLRTGEQMAWIAHDPAALADHGGMTIEQVSQQYAQVLQSEVQRLLPEVRDVGGVDLEMAKGGDAAITDAVRQVQDLLPTDWLTLSNDQGTLIAAEGSATRGGVGFYAAQPGGGGKIVVQLGGASDAQIQDRTLHELAHRMEDVVPGLWQMERDFYAARTADEDAVALKDTIVGTTKLDRWSWEYLGRTPIPISFPGEGGVLHRYESYELLSNGLQFLMAGDGSMIYYLQQDPEYYHFILGVLFGAKGGLPPA